jgi:hypothetical protein
LQVPGQIFPISHSFPQGLYPEFVEKAQELFLFLCYFSQKYAAAKKSWPVVRENHSAGLTVG